MKHLWEYDHPYYASESNYYSNDPGNKYGSWEDFIGDWGNSDMDYNLLIRWDWKKPDKYDIEEGRSDDVLQLTYVLQRKGIYLANFVKVTEADEPAVRDFIAGYWAHMQKVWEGS